MQRRARLPGAAALNDDTPTHADYNAPTAGQSPCNHCRSARHLISATRNSTSGLLHVNLTQHDGLLASASAQAATVARLIVLGALLLVAALQYIATLFPIGAPERINDELPRLARQLGTSVACFLAAWVWVHATVPAVGLTASIPRHIDVKPAMPSAAVYARLCNLVGRHVGLRIAAVSTLSRMRLLLGVFAVSLLAIDSGSSLRHHGAYCWSVWICIVVPAASLHVGISSAIRRWGICRVAVSVILLGLALLPVRSVQLARYREMLRTGLGITPLQTRADGWHGCEWDAASRVVWPVYDMLPVTRNVWSGRPWCLSPSDATDFAVTHAALMRPNGSSWFDDVMEGACPTPSLAAARLPARLTVMCPVERQLWITRLPQVDAMPTATRKGEEMQGAAVLPLSRKSLVNPLSRESSGLAVIDIGLDDDTESFVIECTTPRDGIVGNQSLHTLDKAQQQAAADAAEHVYVPRPKIGELRRLARWWQAKAKASANSHMWEVGNLVEWDVQGEKGGISGAHALTLIRGRSGNDGGSQHTEITSSSNRVRRPGRRRPGVSPSWAAPDLSTPPDVVILLIDALSAPHALRRLPLTTALLASLPQRGYNQTHELRRFHASGFTTGFGVVPLYTGGVFGAPHRRRPGNETLFEWATRARGYVTSLAYAMCEDMGATYADTTWHVAHDTTPRYCVPAAHPLVNPLGNWAGPYSFRPRCMRGRHVHARALDDGLAFWRTYTGRVPRLLAVHLFDAHEGTGEMIALADAAIAEFINEIISRSDGSAGPPVLFVGSDHGLHMGLPWLFTSQGRFEHQMPLGVLAIPDHVMLAMQPTIAQSVAEALRHNSHVLTTAGDIYWTLRDIIDAYGGADAYDARAAQVASSECDSDAPDWREGRHPVAETAGLDATSRLVSSLLHPLPETRSCDDAGVPEDLCMCH